MSVRTALACLFGFALFTLACRERAEDLREWTRADHQTDTQDPRRTGQSTGEARAAPPGLDEVTLTTWSTACANCHGKIGRGDGAQAGMSKPRDLTDPAWQAQVTDEQLAASIKNGKGQMPAFNFPPKTIDSLVKLVRFLDAQNLKNVAAKAAAAGGAPAQ